MLIDAAGVIAIMPGAAARAQNFATPLSEAMGEFSITNSHRQAAFLAQIAHESGELRYMKELGGAAYLAKYDTGDLAKRLGNTPETDGDGQKYCGRGLIQITGRDNYKACGFALGLDLINKPELLELPREACRSAGWFWRSRGLNELADADEFGAITLRINGGYRGLDERLKYWLRARRRFGL